METRADFDATYTFSRASAAWVRNAAGVYTKVNSGESARSDYGVQVEEQRVNLFLNSMAPVTQDITVVSGTTYAVSLFADSGSLTLSGAGTGTIDAGNSAAFTASSTSLTVTVGTLTGDFQCVNVEAGSFGTSPISTTSSTATRRADVITRAITGVGQTGTIVIKGRTGAGYVSGTNGRFYGLDDGSDDNRHVIYRAGSDGKIWYVCTNDGTAVASFALTDADIGNDTEFCAAISFTENTWLSSCNGTAGATDVSGTPPSGITTERIGSSPNGTSSANGYIRSGGYIPLALTQDELNAITAKEELSERWQFFLAG